MNEDTNRPAPHDGASPFVDQDDHLTSRSPTAINFDEVSDIRVAAQRWIDKGYTLVRLRPGQKLPISERAWQNTTPKAKDFESDENIGVQLGAKSGHLVDIDLDIPDARALSSHNLFFAHLPAFHRESLPADAPGHRLVICPDAPNAVTKFSFNKKAEADALREILPKTTILELRCGKCYTVVPPSKHGGDRLVFAPYAGGGVPQIAYRDLLKKASLLAFLSFASACYPPKGSRDEFCMLLAGALIHAGITPEEADELVMAVAEQKHDEEWRKRGGKGKAAADKREARQPVTGLPAFLAHLGLEVCEPTIRKWLDLQAERSQGNPLPDDAIEIGRPDIHNVVREVSALIARKSGKVYRREGELVRIRKLEEEELKDGVFRKAGVFEVCTATAAWLTVESSSLATFCRRRSGRLVVVPPDQTLFNLLHAVADQSTEFPVLRGLSMTPTVDCETPGYDPNSKLFLAFSEGMFPPAPKEPTKPEAEQALERLAHPLRGFPFVDDASRSVMLSAMISAVVRGAMATCPLHVFDAPAAGTGKTKLAEIIGLLGTGVPPAGVTYTDDKDENRKAMVAILRTATPVVLVDNVSSDFEGDFLCQMLSQETVQARVLGVSEMVRLSTRVLVLATGNNIRMKGDMARRAVLCRLDAKNPNPEERKFDFDPVVEVREHRAELVVDALTIVRAYIAAGRPETLPPFGSFEGWDLVRGALVWLGCADPAETRSRVKSDNPLLEEKAELLGSLIAAIGTNRHFTIAEVDAGGALLQLQGALARLLDRGQWNRHAAGQLLRRHRDVPFLGVTLRSKPKRTGVQAWWLEGEPHPDLRQTYYPHERTPF